MDLQYTATTNDDEFNDIEFDEFNDIDQPQPQTQWQPSQRDILTTAIDTRQAIPVTPWQDRQYTPSEYINNCSHLDDLLQDQLSRGLSRAKAISDVLGCSLTAYNAIALSPKSIINGLQLQKHFERYPIKTRSPLLTANLAVDFASDPEKIPFVLCNHIFPRGQYSLLFGAGGAGKSTLLCQIAVQAAASGGVMSDELFHSPSQQKVLIISFEDTQAAYHTRIKRFITDYPQPFHSKQATFKAVNENIHIIDMREIFGTNLLLSTVDSYSNKVIATDTFYHVKQYILDHSYDVVVIDPWHYATTANENDNGQQAQHCEIITKLAADTNSAVVGVAHTSKGGDSTRGASAATDRTRQAFRLDKLSDLLDSRGARRGVISETDLPSGITTDQVRVLTMTKSNFSKVWSDKVYFKQDNHGHLVQFKPAYSKKQSDEDIVLDCIKVAGDAGMCQSDITKATGFSQPKVSRITKTLCEDDLVTETREKREGKASVKLLKLVSSETVSD